MNAPLAHAAALLAALALLAAPARAPRTLAGAGGRPDTLVVDARASTVTFTGHRAAGPAPRSDTAHLSAGLLVIRHEMLEHATFSVATAPAATFTASAAERVGPARWRVSGELARGGTTRPLSFVTDVRWAGIGHMVATTQFPLDSGVVAVTIHARRMARPAP